MYGEQAIARVGEGHQGHQLRLLCESGKVKVTIFIWSRPNLNRLKRVSTFSSDELASLIFEEKKLFEKEF